MAVCVVYPIYSGRQTTPFGIIMWTHQPESHRRKAPSFCGACLDFVFQREKDSAVPFPRRPSSRILFTHDITVLHLLNMM